MKNVYCIDTREDRDGTIYQYHTNLVAESVVEAHEKFESAAHKKHWDGEILAVVLVCRLDVRER